MRFLRLALVFAALFGVGYAYAAMRLFPAAEDPTDVDFTDIPDLTGVSLAEAGERLSALGLVSPEQGSLHHGEIPTGAVVAQRPLPGPL
ncbi:MAG: PASTA domain-containing protein, partial [Acidobacteria bacterium]|nr:PASTA domain-containing protein [Acidobacteriota bacterium]